MSDRHERGENPDEQDEEVKDDKVPTVSMDFAFLGSETDEDQLIVLMMVESQARNIMAQACPDKAIVTGEYSDHIISKCVDQIDQLGFSKVILRIWMGVRKVRQSISSVPAAHTAPALARAAA